MKGSFTWVKENGLPRFIPGSQEESDFWEEEIAKCKNGFKIKGVFIPGALYFYLNYCYISASSPGSDLKKLRLPDFRDLDWMFFNEIHRARQERKGFIGPLPRELGKSYWEAAIVLHGYTFYAGQEILFTAGSADDINPTLNKLKVMMANLPAQFSQRTIKQDWRKEVIAGYETKDEYGITMKSGTGSVIYIRNLKDNPEGPQGLRPIYHLFEEIGKIKNLKEAVRNSRDSWTQAQVQRCVPIFLGTGGDMETGTKDVLDMWLNPKAYNLLEYDCTYEKFSGKTGFFVPATYNVEGTKEWLPLWKHLKQPKPDNKDSLLNTKIYCTTDFEKAEKFIQDKRKTLKEGPDPGEYYKYIMYNPLIPSEVFLKSNSNIFQVHLIQEQITKIITSGFKPQKGFLYPITDPNTGKLTGARWEPNNMGNIQILPTEHPKEGQKYLIGHDPVAFDRATTNSRGSSYVYKPLNSPLEHYDIPVAEYIERATTQDNYNYNLLLLAIYYNNAQILIENNVGDTVSYFRIHNRLDLLMTQPDDVIRDVVPDSKVSRNYGIPMNQKIKERLISNIRDYLELKCSELFFLSLLEELRDYNDDDNFDNVMSFGICLFANQHHVFVEKFKSKAARQLPGVYLKDKNGKIILQTR